VPDLPDGLAGIAVIRAIVAAPDPRAAAQALVEALGARFRDVADRR
jgi:thiamine monophosphate synthase